MRHFSKGLMAAVLINSLMVTGAAYAAPPSSLSNISDKVRNSAARDLQRTREELEQYRRNRQIAEGREQSKVKSETPEGQKAPETANTFHVTKIVTSASKVLTEMDIASVLDKYANTEMTVKGLFGAVKELNALYVAKGYANCKAILEQQVIKGGVVKITLVEAVTSEAKVENNRYTKANYIKNRIHLAQGEVANINTLNKDLLRFNGTNDVQLRVVMQPGSELGTTEYVIQAYEPQQYVTSVFFDNAGSYSSGIYRMGSFFTVKSLSGERDALTLGVIHSKGTDAFAATYNHQVGRSGTKLNLSYNTNSVEVIDGEGADLIDGHAYSYSMGLVQPWVITDKIRSEVSLEYNHQNSKTDFMQTTRLADDTIDEGTLSFSMINYGNSHLFYQRHGYVQGYRGNDLDHGQESANFGFYKFNGIYQKAYGHGQMLSGRLDAQWAGGTIMPSSRQFYLGGMNSVRGYKESIVSGDSGYNLSLEYQVPLQDKKTHAFVFYDYGSVHGESAYDNHVLASLGFGFKANPTKHINASLAFGFPLMKKVNVEEISKARIHFMLAGQF